MGADEEKLEAFVDHAVLAVGHGLERLFDVPGQFRFVAMDHPGVPFRFAQLAPGCRQQPGFRHTRQALLRPVPERQAEGVGQRVLGRRDVARTRREIGDQAAVAFPRHPVDGGLRLMV